MWILGLFFLLILVIIAWILWGKVTLEIDSAQEKYQISGWGIFKGGLSVADGRFSLYLRLPFYTKTFHAEDLLEKAWESKKKPEEKSEKPTKKRSKWKMSWSKIRKMMSSFQVKQLYINFDTDDFVLNGLLYPLAQWVRNNGQAVFINFNGERRINLKVENRLFRIARAYLF